MQQVPTIPQSPHQNSPEMPPPPSENEPMTPSASTPKGEGWRSILSTLVIIIAAPLIALLLINFVFQTYEVDGPSMETTLQNTDKLIVWKAPRTIARIRGKAYIPHRGDIIVFTKRDSYKEVGTGEKQLIKRVIGLPGDRVLVENGKVTIYNDQNPMGYNPDLNAKHGENATYTGGNADITVNEDEVFVLGDNRSNSLDSRVFGTVSADDIVGKLEFRVFPFNKFDQY